MSHQHLGAETRGVPQGSLWTMMSKNAEQVWEIPLAAVFKHSL